MKKASLIILLCIALQTVILNLKAGEEPTDEKIIFTKYQTSGLAPQTFAYGMNGYKKICDSLNKCYRYLCIADFVKPSSEKRLYVIDMMDSSLVHYDYVAHGRNSGEHTVASFSNAMHSNQSSLGFYLISEAYMGKHGLSLRLDGLDEGYNDNARNRAIVMHAAEYAHPSVINLTGRLGRSLGCPALSEEGFSKIAPFIMENSVLFIYYPQESYLASSVWLKQTKPLIIQPAMEGITNNKIFKK